MKLYQLASDDETYGKQAGWWMVVSDDLKDELAGPFEQKDAAEEWIRSNGPPSKLQ